MSWCRKTAASTQPTAQVDPAGPQAGDDSMGFRVWANSSPLTTFISHKGDGTASDDFNSKCEVNAGDTLKHITCLVEGEELDLFHQGVTLKYNVRILQA